jgi:hypothetical protein
MSLNTISFLPLCFDYSVYATQCAILVSNRKELGVSFTVCDIMAVGACVVPLVLDLGRACGKAQLDLVRLLSDVPLAYQC